MSAESTSEEEEFNLLEDENNNLPDTGVGLGEETVVRINTSKLDIYLRDIKAQLIRHEKELNNPGWTDVLKADDQKLSIIARKLEHCQIDINAVKDYMYNDIQRVEDDDEDYVNTNTGKRQKKVDPVLVMKADLEALRIVIRRIELQNSTGVDVFNHIRKLQQENKNLFITLDEIKTINNDQINRLELDFNDKIEKIKNDIEVIADQLYNLTQAKNKMVAEIEDIKVKGIPNSPTKKSNFINSGDDDPKKKDLLGDVSLVSILDERKMTAVAEKQINISLLKLKDKYLTMDKYMNILSESDYTNAKINKALASVKKFCLSKICKTFNIAYNRKIYLVKFKGFHKLQDNMESLRADEKVKRMVVYSNFVDKLEKAASSYKVACYFFKWMRTCILLDEGERLKLWTKGIVKYWYERVCPDRLSCFDKWKKFTVDMRQKVLVAKNASLFVGGGAPNRRASIRSSIRSSTADLSAALKAFENANARSSGDGGNPLETNSGFGTNSAAITRRSYFQTGSNLNTFEEGVEEGGTMSNPALEEAMKGIAEQIQEAQVESSFLRREVTRLSNAVNDLSHDTTVRIENEAKKAALQLSNVKTQITTKIESMDELFFTINSKTDELLQDHSQSLSKLFQETNKLEVTVQSEIEKLQSAVDFQLALSDRLEITDKKQDFLHAKVTAIDGEIVYAAKTATEAFENIKKVEEMMSETNNFFDIEIKGIKIVNNVSTTKINEIVRRNDKFVEKTEGRVEYLEKHLDAIVPKKPSPNELFQLSGRFEDLEIKSHKEGSTSKKVVKKLNEFMDDFSDFVNRTAAYIALKSDLYVIGVIVDFSNSNKPNLNTKAEIRNNLSQQNKKDVDGYSELKVISSQLLHSSITNANTLKILVEKKRLEELQNFLLTYVDFLMEKDPSPGLLKTAARVKLHKKLIVAMDAALSKHYVMKQFQSDNTFTNSNIVLPKSGIHNENNYWETTVSRPSTSMRSLPIVIPNVDNVESAVNLGNNNFDVNLQETNINSNNNLQFFNNGEKYQDISKSRPTSSSVTRHREAVKQNNNSNNNSIVSKSGFKMPFSSSQEELAVVLAENFHKDTTFSRSSSLEDNKDNFDDQVPSFQARRIIASHSSTFPSIENS